MNRFQGKRGPHNPTIKHLQSLPAGIKRKCGVREDRQQVLPDIDPKYMKSGMLIRSLEDPDVFKRAGFRRVAWLRPGPDQHVANTEACVPLDGSGKYGNGYAIRNTQGKMLKIGFGGGVSEDRNIIDGRLVPLAEMLGIENMLTKIDPVEFPRLLVCCDNNQVIRYLKDGRMNQKSSRNDLREVLGRIMVLKAQKYPGDESLVFMPVFREGNFLADWCSTLGLKSGKYKDFVIGQEGFDEMKNEKTVRYFRKRDAKGKNYIRDVKGKQDNNAIKKQKPKGKHENIANKKQKPKAKHGNNFNKKRKIY